MEHASSLPAAPTTRTVGERVLAWVDDASDRLSPIVVKEIRQTVRGKEFNYSFLISLTLSLVVAFFGATRALAGGSGSGGWVFVALTSFLALLGLAVVPLGAFSALRNERLEQTLDLISVTALSPRAIVVGKLLAQGVKLVTFFSVTAPFVAMSFLLGGVDILTIWMTLFVVFLGSMWVSAAALFLSSLLKSRALSGVLFGALAIALLLFAGVGRLAFSAVTGLGPTGGLTTSQGWWAFGGFTVFCVATITNLVLLAENRLSLPTGTVTPLRIGFLVQFLLIVGWALIWVGQPARVLSSVVTLLTIVGGVHLAAVAMFAVTEDLCAWQPARKSRHMRWRWHQAFLGPGGGWGAAYVLVQMACLVLAGLALGAGSFETRRLLATCGYICLLTGVPALVLYRLRPFGVRPAHARIAVLLLLSASVLLPDILYYVLWRPDALDLSYSGRHLLNPLRTLFNWEIVERRGWEMFPLLCGALGLIAYVALILADLGLLTQGKQVRSLLAADHPGEPGGGGFAN
jgi:hypothetical protein